MFHLREVVNLKDERIFLNMVDNIYRYEKNWVRPLDDEIIKIFNKEKNRRFRTGEAIRWIIFDTEKNPVGRIAAFYDKIGLNDWQQPTGGVGFFESINDQNVANLLFDTAKSWLEKKGLEAMDGPVNFGNRDYFWGCLKAGFHQPIFNMPYNPAYYNELFENYGFRNYFDQFTYRLTLDSALLNPILQLKSQRLKRDQKLRITNYNKKSGDQIASDFSEVFNKAWARFPGVEPIEVTQAKALFYSLKPILDERLVILAHYDNQPIGFFIMIPDINQLITRNKGKMNWFNKIKLILDLKVLKKCNRVIGLIFGVIPEFQGKGIEAGLVMKFAENTEERHFPYSLLEMNWIGDFNPTMMKLVELIGGEIYKTHVTYRYLFNPTKPFHRAPVVNSNQ
ncbi:MAG: hypothetical protein K9G61_08525 [Bacteroidales bacterium]|nr:hypothetical protein [Bacteroidales bacterium]